MSDEPDIVKILRKEEKLGMFQRREESSNEELKMMEKPSENPSDTTIDFVEPEMNDKIMDNYLENEKASDTISDLLEIIHFTEIVSTKIQNELEETEIYKIVIDEFSKSNKYSASILLLTNDRRKLRIAGTATDPQKLQKLRSLTGLKIKEYMIPLKKSQKYYEVINKGKTLHAKASEIIREILPSPLAIVVTKTFGYEKKMDILTPLARYGTIIGIVTVSSPSLAEYFIPSVKNLAQHISIALERSEEYAERKKAVEALKESEVKYKVLFEGAGDAIFLGKPNGNNIRFVDCNKRALEMFGCKLRDDIIGKTPLDFSPEKQPDGSLSKQLALERIKIAIEENSKPFTWQHIRLNGSPFDADISMSYVEIGGELFIQGVVRDITDRKKSEEMLREREGKFRMLAEQSLMGIAIIQDDKVKYVNQAACDIIGYSIKEIYNWKPKEFAKVIHPEDFPFVIEQLRKKQTGDAKDIVTRYNYRLVTKNQELKWVDQHSKTIIYEGKTADFITLVDITERKTAEEELRESKSHFQTLFNVMVDPVVIVDSKGKFLEITDKVEEITGFKKEELLGKNFLSTKIVTGKSKRILLKSLIKRMSGSQIKPYEIEVLTKEGKILPYEINAAKIDYLGKPADMVVFRDIFDRKQAEKSLIESEEKFRNLAEESPNMIFINTKGRVVYANRKCEEIMGYKREEFYSSDFNFFNLIASENKELIRENFKKHDVGEDIPPYEYALITKEGKRIEAIITTKLITYESENAILGIVTDITELKQAEEELGKIEEKFKNIANRSSDAIIVTNERGIIDYVSPAVEKISGFTPEECIGKSFFKFLYKTDIPRITKIFNRTIKNREDVENLAIRIKNKNGTMIYGDFSATPILDDGKIVGTQGVIRNVTEHKLADDLLRESEEKYRNIVELAPYGIITTDTKGVVTSCNPAFINLSGFSKEEIVSKHISRLPTMIKRDIPIYLKLFSSFLQGHSQRSFEFKWLHKDGTIRLAEARASLLKQGKKIIGMQAILRDITEQKKAERELHKTQEELQSLNMELEKKVEERTAEVKKLLKLKDEFINQLGHDLKNPLNPILNLLPIVEKKEQDPESKEMLQVVNRSVDYMKNLVVKTIELARLNAPSTEFSFEDTNLLKTVNDVIEKNKLTLDENYIKIKSKISESIIVKADKLRLDELLDNLINNAVKYSPNGGNIIIDAREDEGFVTVSVKDTGLGMNKEQLDHIFDEFYKADHSRHDFDSSGLGLTICKRIVEKHGGRIWAESSGKGRGSSFNFTISKGSKIIEDNISEE